MYIVGAGMAGLLAGHMFRKHGPQIVEAQNDLPNNHDALLRFRSDAVSRATGIPFKKVHVRKSIIADNTYVDNPNPYLANMYSRKVTGEIHGRSIWNTEPATRYVAPRNFISQMATHLPITLSTPLTFDEMRRIGEKAPVISTIPMPTLMKMAGWQDMPEFKWKPIWSWQAEIASPVCDVYQTIYYPEDHLPHYRASITGKTLIVECVDDPGSNWGLVVEAVVDDFGLLPLTMTGTDPKRQEYGKIVAVDREAREDFMYTMTREHNIYSLGRFATWRQLLLDDVVSDCETIERLISAEDRRSTYKAALSSIAERVTN